MEGPVRQRAAQAGRRKAEWSQVALRVLVWLLQRFHVECWWVGGTGRVKEGLESQGEALRVLKVFD